MIIIPASTRARGSRQQGFTLVEVMIGASLGSVVLLGVLTTYLMLLRSGVSASNYAEMESQSRRAFEQLGIDARMASAIVTSVSGSPPSITLTVPNNYTSNSNLVTYAYDSTNQWFYLVPGDGSVLTNRQILIRNVISLAFNRYDASSASTTTDSSTKHIQVSVTVRHSAAGVVAESEPILSAAFTMRNKI